MAILGTGNIGTDLLIKVMRSEHLICRMFAGRNLSSAGMAKGISLGAPVSAKGIEAISELRGKLGLVFDATSAESHRKHAPMLAEWGLPVVDLTPAQIGTMCVPAVNLSACLRQNNVNMVTCGGQAAIPLANAFMESNPGISYLETVSSIASRSAGPATRINLDEYLATTEKGVRLISGCGHSKAILNLNPAQPCIHMQTTVMGKVENPNLTATRERVAAAVAKIREYVPGYALAVPPVWENGRLFAMVRVEGRGDYLPRYAGNLDIINCAAIAFAEGRSRLFSTEIE